LNQARSIHSLSLVWTKAHTKKNSMVANGNRKADSLALVYRRELARSLAHVDLLASRRPLDRRSTLVSLDRWRALSKRARPGLLASSTSSSLSVPDLIPCLHPPPGGDIVADYCLVPRLPLGSSRCHGTCHMVHGRWLDPPVTISYNITTRFSSKVFAFPRTIQSIHSRRFEH